MSNDPKSTPPTPDIPPGLWPRILTAVTPYLPSLKSLIVNILAAVLGAMLHWAGAPPTVVEVVKEVVKDGPAQQAAPVSGGDDFAPTFGWHHDPEAVRGNLDPDRTAQFDATPAGRAALGDDDAFLWRHVRKAAGQESPWYPNVNQKSVGCCVGCGWKHCADVCQATAIAAGKAFEFRPVSVEVIYGGSRVDVGGGRISGDGSVGAWAKEYVQSKGGIAAMQKYESVDLTVFSPTRARQFGKSGAPADVKAAAKEHPVKGCALVKSWADVKRSVQQGYPVAVCSDQGFTMERDATGRCRPQGTWPHCMAIIGVRSKPEGAFILNSWGDSAHTGPAWPADMPVAGFWADASVIDRMVRQGDSFALADVAGFPARKIDWFVHAEPRRARLDLFAHNSKLEVPLSW